MIENAISRVNETDYVVKSQSGNGEYHVSKTLTGWICQCPDFMFRGWTCKHIYAVQISFELRQEVSKRNLVLEPVNVSQCQFCGSSKLRKFGVRHNKSGDIQRYLCEFCKRSFSVNIAFEKMRHNPQAVTTAMQLYFSGASLRNTQKSLRLLGVNVSYQTIFKWIRKYVSLMQAYAEKITPNVSDTWRADEMYVKVKGNMKYLFAVIDDETRFWIAKEVANTKQEHDAKGLFRNAKALMGKAPIRLITDGLGSYQNAYESEFKNPSRATEHVREIALDGEIHNNKMERFNEEFRAREKVTRNLKTKDSPMISGYQLFHNFIREHSALSGKTPAEACGIVVKGSNKWLTLIQNASLAKSQKSNTSEFDSFSESA